MKVASALLSFLLRPANTQQIITNPMNQSPLYKQTYVRTLIVSCFFLIISLSTNAQVSINNDGSQPNASAMLDVKSTSKGMLVPRMSTAQRSVINNPAVGLLVFDTDTESFWFRQISGWLELVAGNILSIADTDQDTKIQVEESADEDIIRFDVDGNERLRLETDGTLNINNAFRLANMDGTNGQILTTDGNGNTSWQAPNASQGLLVSDTCIEESIEDARFEETGNLRIPNSLWQEVVPLNSGFLASIEIRFFGTSSSFSGGILNVYEGSGIGGQLLYTRNLESLGAGWQTIATDTSVVVTAGSSYTFELIESSGNFDIVAGSVTDYSGSSSPSLNGDDVNFRTNLYRCDNSFVISQPTAKGTVNLGNIDTVFFTDGSFQTTSIFALDANGTGVYSLKDNGNANEASGTAAFAVGDKNTADGDFSVVSGGVSNKASGTRSVISGGQGNTANGDRSVVSGGRWNDANGVRSVVSGGQDNTANGDRSVVSGGKENSATREFATVSGGDKNSAIGMASVISGGSRNTAAGSYNSIAGGNGNSTIGSSSTVSGGNSNVAAADFSAVLGGRNNLATSYGEIVTGVYSTRGGGSINSWVATDRLFNVGNGTADNDRSNAFSIYKNANTEVGGSLTFNKNGTNTSVTLPTDRGTNGQVLTTDGNGGTSWQVTNSIWAIDANGTGIYSLLDDGMTNEASGTVAFSAGDGNTASGDFSVVSGGRSNLASNLASVVSGGSNNVANRNFSVVSGGDRNTANNNYSVVSGGENNTASGRYSVVQGGASNTAASYGETVTGLFSTIAGGSGEEWVGTDRLFNVGNGTFTNARSDAFTIFKNANTEVGGSLTFNNNGTNTSVTLPTDRGTNGQALITDGSGNATWQAIPNMDLINFTESNYTYDGKTGVKFLANNAATDVDVVLQPKRNGGILAQEPNGTTIGGNNRGANAIDFQMERTIANQVASGSSSVISGGRNNIANGTQSNVAGGAANSASGTSSVVSGGQDNTATGTSSVVSGGENNTASGTSSVVSGGDDNVASGDYSLVSGGDSNTASGVWSMVFGGEDNVASGVYSAVSGVGNTAASAGETVIGGYSTLVGGTSDAWVATDRLFTVGNGQNTDNRSDAFTIFKNANTAVGGALTFNNNGTNTSVTLPSNRGTNGQVLTTDGSGNADWQSTFNGDVVGNVTGNLTGNVSGGTIQLGTTSVLTGIIKTSIIRDVGNINGNDFRNETFTIVGASVGDVVHISPRDDLGSRIVIGQARVSAGDTITVKFRNVGGSGQNPPEMAYDIVVISSN